MSEQPKYVASTVIVGPRGQPVVTRGYTEIFGIRIYDDQVVVGDRGQHVISRGWIETIPPAAENHTLPFGDRTGGKHGTLRSREPESSVSHPVGGKRQEGA